MHGLSGRRGPTGPLTGLAAAALAALAALLAGCVGYANQQSPAPVETSTSTVPGSAGTVAGNADTASLPGAPAAPATEAAARTRARWVSVGWEALPGWSADRAAQAWPALKAGCAKPAPAWAKVCARVNAVQPGDDAAVRGFLQRELVPYRVEATTGETQGLATGYFEPLLAASRVQRPGFDVPLYRPPADLAQRRPYWTRQELETLPAARAALKGQEIAWLASPLDALLLQVQGSGRLRITERNGSQRLVRMAYAAHNDQPYQSVGRWLIDRGELRRDNAGWPAIRDWGQRASPERLNQMLWSNPRMVFFREEPIADENQGPRGAQGVPLTAGRSVAVDPQSVPYGTPLWLDTTEPLSATPLRRLVLAQDTGSAITGAVRVDYFWGWGEQAEQLAGRMKQPLKLWALWPRDTAPQWASAGAAPGPGVPAGTGAGPDLLANRGLSAAAPAR